VIQNWCIFLNICTLSGRHDTDEACFDRTATWAASSWPRFTPQCWSCLLSLDPMPSLSLMHLTFLMHFCAVYLDVMMVKFMKTSTAGQLSHLSIKNRWALAFVFLCFCIFTDDEYYSEYFNDFSVCSKCVHALYFDGDLYSNIVYCIVLALIV